MKWIEDLLIFCHIFHYFDFFPFHVIYSINKTMLWLEKRKKSKQWRFCNKLKTQLTIFRLRFSQRIFNHFLVNKVFPVLIFFFDLKLKWFRNKIEKSLINFWSKLNIGITLFARKWLKLVDIFGQYILQVSFFEFMSNFCCFDLFPFNLFTPKTNYVMLWLKRIKDQIVEKKYFEQEFHQVSTRQLIQYVLSAQNHTSYCTTKFMTIYKFGCFWKVLSSHIFWSSITRTILCWKYILNELSVYKHRMIFWSCFDIHVKVLLHCEKESAGVRLLWFPIQLLGIQMPNSCISSRSAYALVLKYYLLVSQYQ